MAKSGQKKDAALVALLESNSMTEAAEKAGVSRRTMYNYLHNDIAFARAYDEARNRQEIAYMDVLTTRRERAQGVVMEVLEDDDQPAAIRLKAAQIIIAAAAEQGKTVARITQSNISANKDMFDVSYR